MKIILNCVKENIFLLQKESNFSENMLFKKSVAVQVKFLVKAILILPLHNQAFHIF